MEGCDLFCSFCIVPRTRGREISRPAAGDRAPRRAPLAARGVREITLLGQTVNAYGRHDLRRGRASDGTVGFAALLARLAAIPGLARIRYTSPHPVFFDDELIRAHARAASAVPARAPAAAERLGSRCSRACAAATRADDYRRLVGAPARGAPGPRAHHRPDRRVSRARATRDFEATLALVREVGFVDAFSFKYSPRPGTAAARDPDAGRAATSPRRGSRTLQELQRELTLRGPPRARRRGRPRCWSRGESRRGGGQGAGAIPTTGW